MNGLFLKILKKKLRFFAKLTLWRYNPRIIGITGNVGKTSTKSAVESVLSHSMNVRASAKSFNNEIGVPLAIIGDWKQTGGILFWCKVFLKAALQIVIKSRKYPEVLILEYGVDHPGDMARLLDIARPKIGVVTAMGDTPVHIEFFPNKEAVAREKAKLISQLPATGFAFLNMDDPIVYGMAEKTRSHVVSFGFDNDADLKITSFETLFNEDATGITFKLNYGGSFIPVRLNNVIGKSQTYAAAVAAGIGIVFDMNLVDISEALEAHHSPAGRMRIISGIKDSHIIDDTYNAAPLAMEKALESCGDIDAKRKIAVLGDMLELGEHTLEAHKQVGKLAAKKVDMLVTVGMRGKFIAEGAQDAGMKEKQINHFDSVHEAGLFVQDKIQSGDLILVKASQGARFEKIVKEIMAEPDKAEDLLVRQNKRWLEKEGMYG